MRCHACGNENDAGRKFCTTCGASLAGPCASCGTVNPAGSRFCGECGASLVEPEARPEAQQGERGGTERRLVSVLFLDLVSFTTLSEQRDPEDVRTLLSAYFDTARAVVERHGGVIEKFIGDAVMAVWGAPVAHEDDAERAVRTALELVDAVAALGEREAVPLRARGGVLTGEAATMPGAVSEGMVTGDMVNTAARLQSAAEPGTVFVGEATYRATARTVAFEDVGELTLKGKEAPVRAWRALRVVAERGGANRVALEPPFVGRAEELRLLKELLHATGRERRSRTVSVVGIAGIGKSRLAWELLKYVDGLTEEIYWHQGRCPAYGDGVTFWALGEMVKARAGIGETDPAPQARATLAASVAALVADPDERRWIEPRLAFLLALDERPPGGREELFAAWRAYFERVAALATVVMVFEDLQWADPGLLDFVDAIQTWSREHPILVLTLARPELAERRPGWGGGQRAFSSMRLDPIPDDAMAALVAGLVPGADAGAVARIVQRAEGVPLYAVETLRMLADQGVLRADDEAYELVGDLGDLRMPETLQALVASRLDALDPADRGLLQDAAVLGTSFSLDSLAAVTGKDPAALEARLRDLGRKELVRFEANPRSPERGQYAFVQGMIREVAYGMLSKADRRAKHLATAHHFESLEDPELASIVAAQYLEALRATPEGPDADALAARARDRLGEAADRASALGSPEQALAFVEQALAITAEGKERASLLMAAAKAAEDALRTEDRRRYLEAAVSAARAAGDLATEARAANELANALFRFGRKEEVLALVLALAEEIERRVGDGDLVARGELADIRSALGFFTDDYEVTLRHNDEALAIYEALGDETRVVRLLAERAANLQLLGRHLEGLTLQQGLLARVRARGDLRAIAETSFLVGASLSEDDLRGALEVSLEGVEAARRGGYRGRVVDAMQNAVEFAIELGEWDTADELLGAAAELVGDSAPGEGFAIVEALLRGYRGDAEGAAAALARSDPDLPMFRDWFPRVRAATELAAGDLVACYRDAMVVLERSPGGGNAPFACWTATHAALPLDAADGTAERSHAVLAVASTLRGAWIANIRRSLEAGIAFLEGRTADAADGLAQTLATWDALRLPFDHAWTVIDAHAVGATDLLPDGAAATARAYLEGLGAGPLLARLPEPTAPHRASST